MNNAVIWNMIESGIQVLNKSCTWNTKYINCMCKLHTYGHVQEQTHLFLILFNNLMSKFWKFSLNLSLMTWTSDNAAGIQIVGAAEWTGSSGGSRWSFCIHSRGRDGWLPSSMALAFTTNSYISPWPWFPTLNQNCSWCNYWLTSFVVSFFLYIL